MSQCKDIKDNNKIESNNYKVKKEPKHNKFQKYLYNNKRSINNTLNDNTKSIKSINDIKKVTYAKNNSESKSFFENKDDINLINNIKNNKYLIPIIEKKNMDDNIYQKKIKETPFYISDFFSKVRKKSERIRTKSEKSTKRNINTNNSYENYENSFENVNNNNNYENIKNNKNKRKFNKQIMIHNESSDFKGYKNEDNFGRYLTDYNQNNNNSNSEYIIKKKKLFIPYQIGDDIKSNIEKIDNIKYKHGRYITSLTSRDLFNNSLENERFIDGEERVIYPKEQNNVMDYNKSNYYLKKNNIQEIKKSRKDIKIDFDNYLQKKNCF